jgi:hypothetical protein
MLLLRICCDREVAEGRMTTAIKLVFAQAFVSISTALVRLLWLFLLEPPERKA